MCSCSCVISKNPGFKFDPNSQKMYLQHQFFMLSEYKFKMQRPGSAASVMSQVSTLSALERPGTATFCLPKLNGSSIISSPLPPINEDDQLQETHQEKSVKFETARETISPHHVSAVELNDSGIHDVDENEVDGEQQQEISYIK